MNCKLQMLVVIPFASIKPYDVENILYKLFGYFVIDYNLFCISTGINKYIIIIALKSYVQRFFLQHENPALQKFYLIKNMSQSN